MHPVWRTAVLVVAGWVGAAAGAETPTLKQIMADPAWVARSPTAPCFSWDGRSILFDRQREGSRLRDRWRVGLDGGEPVRIEDRDLPFITDPGGAFNTDRSLKVFSRSGDVFERDMLTGALTQLTRTTTGEYDPMFMADGSIAFRRDGVWILRDADTGNERQVADIRAQDDPEKKKDEKKSYLEEQQLRLFDSIREREERKDEREARDKARRDADPTRVPGPFYLGSGWRVQDRALSPAGRWMLLSVSKDPGREKHDKLAAYVNDDGYVSTRDVRPHVGEEKRRDDRLVLLDLDGGRVYWLDDSVLPTIGDDPLAWLKDRKEADEKKEEAKPDEQPTAEGAAPSVDAATAQQVDPQVEIEDATSTEPEPDSQDQPATESEEAEKPAEPVKPRACSVERIEWSPDGTRVAVQLRSNDNKDRWIATVEFPAENDDEPRLDPVHHLRDEAWIGWDFNEMGWTRDSSSLWFLSEETGYGQLYLWDASTSETRALTEGRFTVQDVQESPTGGVLYYRANRRHPGLYEIERVDISTGESLLITVMAGTVESYDLSPDGSRAVFLWSTEMDPPELYVQEARPGAEPVRLTHTDTDLYRSFDWVRPRFVEVPSSHTERPIHCLLWEDPDVPAPSDRGKPVVLFSHGAGYLQDVYNGWSYYFREHMFHTLLCRMGYIVIGPDFRASAGYGRDWRTAIYRQMGTPELEDFDDCLAWLGENTDADLGRVGIYGGSYGGFMTLMAMFERPGIYRCGAALRPVTDWAHYNHGYTANILNTPDIDPEAYERSSPIEHAEGLEGALLICHGLVDDNVVAQDTIRLSQRLIELEKQNWEIALYPVESHSFHEAASWLNEYRRILKLFETNLK
ncbi:MAG: S9 family peptidase [Phycisphaeraceae bacterium]|nr:MAG: S9 family peptidase [Phycisphaeraceae bacterium]